MKRILLTNTSGAMMPRIPCTTKSTPMSRAESAILHNVRIGLITRTEPCRDYNVNRDTGTEAASRRWLQWLVVRRENPAMNQSSDNEAAQSTHNEDRRVRLGDDRIGKAE